MAVWRIHLGKRFDYCKENCVAALGWSILNSKERDNISTFEEWEKEAKKQYTGKGIDAVNRMYYSVRKDDIIWTKSEGTYYIARVPDDGVNLWRFNSDKKASGCDASNQLVNIKWHESSNFGDESSIPGTISTAFIKGTAFQRINKKGVEQFSKICFNKLQDEKFKYTDLYKIEFDKEDFFNMLSPEEAEDLLYSWLYYTKGYIMVPSTNKLGTQKYEFVLLDPKDKNKRHIYVQVKNGNVNLNENNYKNLTGELYLLTTNGKVTELEEKDDKLNIIIVNPEELFEFAYNIDKTNENGIAVRSIISESIENWIDFLQKYQYEEGVNKTKGIMFDTNLSYSETNEKEMLKGSYIAAYGLPQKYVDSFNLGDYVLYFSKGKGVIAIGKIKSSTIQVNDNEKRCEVDLIVPSKEKVEEICDKNLFEWLNAKEIKEILIKNFYFASTMKVPFLTEDETKSLINELQKKYSLYN